MPPAWTSEAVRTRLAGPGADQLQAVVRAALTAPAAVVTGCDVTLLKAQQGLAGDGWLHLVAGEALVDGRRRAWRLVLKVLAPVESRDDPRDIFYWKRELLLHASGVLDLLPAGVAAPRTWATEELPDRTGWLWLEHVEATGQERWSPDRWAMAGRHLGRVGAAFVGRELPASAGLSGGRLRSWLAAHEQQVARIAAAPARADVRQWWPRPIVGRILRLWAERDTFCEALEAMPGTLGHGDPIRRNMFARRRPDGADETVLIDWAFAGSYALGEDAGQMVSVASAFYDVDPSELPTLDEVVFDGYLAGLREGGWQGDPRTVRLAYCAHAALRNGFNAVGAVKPDDPARAAAQALAVYGRTFEELAVARAAARPFLLRLADEARALMGVV